MRIRIFEFWLINPFPIGYPSKSCTVTTSPFLNRPVMVSISLSKIHAPPALMVRPSPFFNVTIALISALLHSKIFITSTLYPHHYSFSVSGSILSIIFTLSAYFSMVFYCSQDFAAKGFYFYKCSCVKIFISLQNDA